MSTHDKEENREFMRHIRAKRMADGLCRDCGRQREDETKKACERCRLKSRLRRSSKGTTVEHVTKADGTLDEGGYRLENNPRVQMEMSCVRDRWL